MLPYPCWILQKLHYFWRIRQALAPLLKSPNNIANRYINYLVKDFFQENVMDRELGKKIVQKNSQLSIWHTFDSISSCCAINQNWGTKKKALFGSCTRRRHMQKPITSGLCCSCSSKISSSVSDPLKILKKISTFGGPNTGVATFLESPSNVTSSHTSTLKINCASYTTEGGHHPLQGDFHLWFSCMLTWHTRIEQ